MSLPRLTVGMPVYDDFDGVYFTVMNILMNHKDVVDNIDFVIIDNNPDSKHGKETYEFSKKIQRCHYSAIRGATGSTIKNLVFELSPNSCVLCLDCHVFVWPKSLERLMRFYANNPHNYDLLHGPLVDEQGGVIATGMLPNFRGKNFGTWELDPELAPDEAAPKEIAGHGMGLFASRRESWPRFTPGMREFGGEEMLIHERYRLSGKKVWCLPFMKWAHRFQRPVGIQYPINARSKAINFMIGLQDIHQDPVHAFNYYARQDKNHADLEQVLANIRHIPPTCPKPEPGYVPFLGHEIQLLD